MMVYELRIGNWVGKNHFIEGNKVPDFQITDYDLSHFNGLFHGIPLTEEILVKLGFEWYEPLKHYRLVINDVWYSIKKQHFDNGEAFTFTFVNLNWNEAQSMPPKTIKYVHKLQNLMYELSGQELIYKS